MRISDWSSDVCSSDLSKWSYGASANYKHEFDDGSEASARISFTHRDMAFSTDDNRGFLNAVEYLDAGITYEFRGGWAVSLYGKNLTTRSSTVSTCLLPSCRATPIRRLARAAFSARRDRKSNRLNTNHRCPSRMPPSC